MEERGFLIGKKILKGGRVLERGYTKKEKKRFYKKNVIATKKISSGCHLQVYRLSLVSASVSINTITCSYSES